VDQTLKGFWTQQFKLQLLQFLNN